MTDPLDQSRLHRRLQRPDQPQGIDISSAAFGTNGAAAIFDGQGLPVLGGTVVVTCHGSTRTADDRPGHGEHRLVLRRGAVAQVAPLGVDPGFTPRLDTGDNHDRHDCPRPPFPVRLTLAETLLASVLGAMLLSSLALTTYGFTHTLDYMEQAAGVNDDADPVLRRLTKDIREAWYVTMPTTQKLDVADANGSITEYYVQDAGLWVKRPNGDTGKIYGDFLNFTMDAQTVQRKREGPTVSTDGIFYAAAPSGSASTLVATGSSEGIALGFTAPADPGDIPGQSAAEEQILSLAVLGHGRARGLLVRLGHQEGRLHALRRLGPGHGAADRRRAGHGHARQLVAADGAAGRRRVAGAVEHHADLALVRADAGRRLHADHQARGHDQQGDRQGDALRAHEHPRTRSPSSRAARGPCSPTRCPST